MKRAFTKFLFTAALTIGITLDAVAQAPAPPPGTVRQQGQDVDLGGPNQTTGSAAATQKKQADPVQEMRNLVRDISKYARRFNRNFSVVTQGGLELIEKIDAVDTTRRSPASTYMRSMDGIVIPGLNFHPPIEDKDEIITDKKIQAEWLRLADLGKNRGLKIFVTDFAANEKTVAEAFKFNASKGYVPFAAPRFGSDYIFDSIPKWPRRPVNENPKNVVGIKGVQNYLFLTDSSKFDRQQDFVIALSNTNYDAVVVDVFHRGRTPFSKAAVRGMKFKKLGARRLVLAYMNVGAAENYRYYWRDNWEEGNPPFISGPTPGNPDKFYVEYWQPGWRQVITGNTNSYLYGIVSQGFDGVLIDGLDSVKFFEGG